MITFLKILVGAWEVRMSYHVTHASRNLTLTGKFRFRYGFIRKIICLKPRILYF